MRKLALAALVLAALAAPAAAHGAAPRVLAVRFAADVNPATEGYLDHQIRRAAGDGYDAVVILLDTPGGLSDSMRKIMQTELASTVPVIVYVWPAGARAASAGVWISQAADVLAMGPETNIGSSTPIESSGQNIGSDLRRKTVNDAAASLRGLAKSHHRNAKWADSAVRVASNLTADEALARNVIDLQAPTLPALLRRLDGYRTKDAQRPFALHLAGARIDRVSPGFTTRLLNLVIDPNLISILFLAGLAGLFFEVLHPGVVLPGALGAVCLLIALYGFSVLQPSWVGIVLVLLGVALLLVDLHAMTHGVLTVAGLIPLGFGLVLLFQNEPPSYQVDAWLVVGVGCAIAAFWSFALGKGVAARRLPVAVGPETLIGAEGEVRRDGQVFVAGELWRAVATDGSLLVPGRRVRVESLDGLVLVVRPLPHAATVT
ncbi:MAG TPA: nodulation protein NfeD [Gaiellaceae bacterium]|nr:nodulation protein NfeD [Gaiellaceae bacterium]